MTTIAEKDVITADDYEMRTLPTGLKVLTILTFIGSGIQILAGAWSFISAKSTFEKKDEVLAAMNNPDMPGFAKKMMGDPDQYVLMITKSFENRIPILIVTLVAAALCIYGAMQMRQLKKQGFLIYVVGEILPIITTALFIGTFVFSGMSMMIGLAIVLLFIIMYAVNRKHLVY